MAKNLIHKPGYRLSVPCTDPATPASGDPVRYGSMTGVALTDEGEGGNAANEATVDFGPGVWDLSVKGVDDGGNSAVSPGDSIFYVDADTPKLSKKSSGYFFGYALESVDAGATATIQVLHVPSPGSGSLGAGTVGTANLADGAVTAAKIAGGGVDGSEVSTVADANVIGGVPVLHRINIAGGAAGNTNVTLTHKTRVIDVWAVHTGGAGETGDTIRVLNGANAITDAMDWSGADTAIVRASQIDDAYHEIAAGGTLRVTTTDNDSGGDVGAGVVYVLGIRVA